MSASRTRQRDYRTRPQSNSDLQSGRVAERPCDWSDINWAGTRTQIQMQNPEDHARCQSDFRKEGDLFGDRYDRFIRASHEYPMLFSTVPDLSPPVPLNVRTANGRTHQPVLRNCH